MEPFECVQIKLNVEYFKSQNYMQNRISTPALTKHEGDSASNHQTVLLVGYVFEWHN